MTNSSGDPKKEHSSPSGGAQVVDRPEDVSAPDNARPSKRWPLAVATLAWLAWVAFLAAMMP